MDRIFIAHAQEDKPQVRQLYDQLKDRGFDPWLDEIDLVPGQIWKDEIPKALADAGVVLACLSTRSCGKVGYVQNEFRRALAGFYERPAGSIYLIPVRLDDCEVPDLRIPDLELSLKHIQWVNLFEEGGFDRLISAIQQALAGGAPSTPADATSEANQANTLPAPERAETEARSPPPPKGEDRVVRAGAPKRERWNPVIVAAVIGAIATVIAAILVSPWFGRTLVDKGREDEPADIVASEGTTTPSESVAITAPVVGETFRDCKTCPNMVMLPAGSFLMGEEEERPVHTVTISEPFALGKYEVTFEEYDRFAEATGRDHPDDKGWGRGQQPVIHVNWEEAKAYCAWLSDQTGQHYRLPSEAEWEYAARAGTTTRYAFGNEFEDAFARIGVASFTFVPPYPVGRYAGNEWDLHDMHGNVWEWVEDHWHHDYTGAPRDGSAWLDVGGYKRVLRGGSWTSDEESARSASRNAQLPGWRFSDIGFRCARVQG